MNIPSKRTGSRLARYLIRGPWENSAITLICLGIFMLMQPFLMVLYSYSFTVILIGTLGFVVVSHFPESREN